MTTPDNVLLGKRQRLAGRERDLQFDQVDAGDELGDRVFDLQARVHLDEVVLAARIDEELDRADILVANRGHPRAGNATHLESALFAQQRRRALLDHLLVSTLDAAFALAQVHDVALAIGGDLNLDVMAALDQAFQVQATVAEVRLRLELGDGKDARQLVRVVSDAHTAAAAAGHGLEHERKAKLASR